MPTYREKLRGILTRREIKKFALLFLAILAMGFAEVVGIAAIMPFMELVSKPEVIHQNSWLQWAFDNLGFENERTFLLASGGVVLLLLGLSNGISSFTQWFQLKVVWSTAHGIASRMMEQYMYQPYEFFLRNNSSELGAQLLYEVTQLARFFLLPLTDVTARTFVSLAILGMLFFVNAVLTLFALLTLGGAYLLIYFGVRKYLSRVGMKRFKANQMRFRASSEALSGIKTIKILGRENFFLQRFVVASNKFSSIIPMAQAVSMVPRYLVETMAFGGIIAIVLYLLAASRDLNSIIPVLSLFALAGYRLLPSLQMIFKSVSQIRYNHAVLDAIFESMVETRKALETKKAFKVEKLSFQREIRVEDLVFKYAGTDEVVLKNINLVIPRGSSVAFVGSTGSGKTTLVDLIVGMLYPARGKVLVDGVELTPGNVAQWQRIAGYVPQEVMLYDDTVMNNIIFGLETYDVASVYEAAKTARIHDFIVNELPDGYDTVVGEQGVRLSGGQRQRIGLARALYSKPEVLVLDEATSALDVITEEAVMQAINRLKSKVTTIQIAHRLDTVRNCDRIYLLDGGVIVAQGTYKELVDENAVFRAMAKFAS